MSGTTARRRARRGSVPRRSNTQQLSQLTVLLNTIRNSRGQQQQAPRASAAAAQTLVCNFSSVAAPREIRYTAVGGTVGTWVNTAMVTYDAADSPKSAQASVTVVCLLFVLRHTSCVVFLQAWCLVVAASSSSAAVTAHHKRMYCCTYLHILLQVPVQPSLAITHACLQRIVSSSLLACTPASLCPVQIKCCALLCRPWLLHERLAPAAAATSHAPQMQTGTPAPLLAESGGQTQMPAAARCFVRGPAALLAVQQQPPAASLRKRTVWAAEAAPGSGLLMGTAMTRASVQR